MLDYLSKILKMAQKQPWSPGIHRKSPPSKTMLALGNSVLDAALETS